MRGDRPPSLPSVPVMIAAAPHARGSTQRTLRRVAELLGCPACAGIDPAAGAQAPGCTGLPRMRGDRPDIASQIKQQERAAPHARGSTRCRPGGTVDGRGCPACAGIDPRGAPSSAPCAGLPRMRGDRPGAMMYPLASELAAPHARGSTLWHVPAPEVSSGCPACAGIDPRVCRESCSERWLPRMRGDRPSPPTARGAHPTAAPHARGSTFASDYAVRPVVGCPACAGIDPNPPR